MASSNVRIIPNTRDGHKRVRTRTPNTISKREGWWVGGGHLYFSPFIITPIATKPNHTPTSLYSSFSSAQQPNLIGSHHITVIAFVPHSI